jgi:hypothetical protein
VSGTLLLLLVGRVIFNAWMTGLEIFLITDLLGEKLPINFFNLPPKLPSGGDRLLAPRFTPWVWPTEGGGDHSILLCMLSGSTYLAVGGD